MTLVLRLCLGLAGLAGASTAVGVPLLLNSGEATKKLAVSPPGGGFSQISIDKCEGLKGEKETPVDFGSPKANSICGRTKSESGEIKNSSAYNSLFQEQGGEKDRDWNRNDNQTQGTQQCLEINNLSQGAIVGSSISNGVQHIGFCGESNSADTKFVKKTKLSQGSEIGDIGKIWICEQDCGKTENDSIDGSPKTFQEENRDNNNGKEVEFYQKS